MDVQMPRMDGYETTRRIHMVAPELPVIGLTAHAMEEERVRCIAAGMVSQITKPIDVDTLVAALQEGVLGTRVQGRSGSSERAVTKHQDESRSVRLPGIDIEGAMKNLNCDWPAFRQILFTFYSSQKNRKEEIESSIDRGSIFETREIAHLIRGASGYVGAWKLHHEAAALEEACKTGKIDVVKEQVRSFSRGMDEVIAGLERLYARE
jgi:response regulator RpfG family c-di-GMP phosphodiesterase